MAVLWGLQWRRVLWLARAELWGLDSSLLLHHWDVDWWGSGRRGSGPWAGWGGAVVVVCWCSQGTGTLSHAHHIIPRCCKNSGSKHANVVLFSLLSCDKFESSLWISLKTCLHKQTGLKMGFLSNHADVSNTLIFPGTVNEISDLKAPMCLLLTTVRHCHRDDI